MKEKEIRRGSQIHRMNLKYFLCTAGINLVIYACLFFVRTFIFTVFVPPPYLDLVVLISIGIFSYLITNYLVNRKFYSLWFRQKVENKE